MTTQKITALDVKILGRHIIKDDILYPSFSASGIEFNFTGTVFSMRIRTDRADDDIQRAYLGVFADGRFLHKVKLDKPEADYEIYKSDAAKPTVIRIIRFSENNFGKAGLISATFDGEISATPNKKFKIEFIGDSITCGYGVEGIFMQDNFSTATENPSLAYSLKTAELLDADYSLCSWSGNGIVTNWIPPEKDEPDHSVPFMPELYPYTDLTGAAFQGFTNAPEYDFGSFQPDVVVLNLGTNDHSYTRGIESRVSDFGKRYGDFVRFIRSKRPNAAIIGCLGVMGQDLCAEEAHQFELLKDDNAFYMVFDLQKEEDGIGVDWHPSSKTHTKMAEKLSAFIRKNVCLNA